MNKVTRKVEVFAVDFDGTIVENKWPLIGSLIPKAKEVINRFVLGGGKVIIWTCREGNKMLEAERFLQNNSIYYHAINENLPERIDLYGSDCRKVGADLYIDDLSVGGADWEMAEQILFGRG